MPIAAPREQVKDKTKRCANTSWKEKTNKTKDAMLTGRPWFVVARKDARARPRLHPHFARRIMHEHNLHHLLSINASHEYAFHAKNASRRS